MKILVAGAYDDQLAEFRRLFPDVAFVRAENTAPPVETRGANESLADRSVLCFKGIQAAVFSIVA